RAKIRWAKDVGMDHPIRPHAERSAGRKVPRTLNRSLGKCFGDRTMRQFEAILTTKCGINQYFEWNALGRFLVPCSIVDVYNRRLILKRHNRSAHYTASFVVRSLYAKRMMLDRKRCTASPRLPCAADTSTVCVIRLRLSSVGEW